MHGDEAMNFGFLCREPAVPNGRSVGIIGAGPTGLAAAGYLACLGYAVDVYDKLPRAGGLMVFGIPSYRIPAERIQAGVRLLERKYGVNFHTRVKICCSAPLHEEEGDHFTHDMRGLGELVEKHDALIVCTGSWKSRRLGVEGENLSGVYSGLEFLFPIRAKIFGAPGVKVPEVAGKRVAVIGAGFSAVDVVHACLNLDASKVHMLYRRTSREAPCGGFELEHLQTRGAEWRELCSPVRILGRERVTGIELSRCTLGEPDGSGRRCPVPVPEGNEVLNVDLVITCIGEMPAPPFPKELGLEDVRHGDIHWLHMTRIENVFVAGDALTGPSKIGKAIFSGLKAARSLTNWLDLKAQNRQAEYKYDDLVHRDERRRG